MIGLRDRDGRIRIPDARIGIGVALIAVSVLGGLRISGAGAATQQVLAFRSSFASGHVLTRTDLSAISVHVSGAASDTLVASSRLRSIVGRPLARAVQADAPVLSRDLGSADADAREMTVPITPDHALGGALEPGDRVDVLATFDHTGSSARTLLVTSGAEVVATVRDASVFGGESGVTALTLAVPNDDAMYVVFAVRTGEIDIVRAASVPSSRTRVDVTEVP
jgi:Flp pilus assembly protein CpaB